jgi:hypothetical protein
MATGEPAKILAILAIDPSGGVDEGGNRSVEIGEADGKYSVARQNQELGV